MKRINALEARDAIARRDDFDAGNLRGRKSTPPSYGYMPDEQKAYLNEEISASKERGDIDSFYTVLSYGTPIAWYTTGAGWRVTTVKYSPTTSKHTSIVSKAVEVYYNNSPLFPWKRVSTIK